MSAAQSLEHWRWHDQLSVVQAALLMLGSDPGDSAVDPASLPNGYVATMSALTKAVLSGDLLATIRRSAWPRGWDEDPGEGERGTTKVAIDPWDTDFNGESRVSHRPGTLIYREEPDWQHTTVRVQALRDWLASRGFKPAFFFPQAEAHGHTEYLDPQHPRYAPKLAATVAAWQAVHEAKGVSPMQALTKWLEHHAASLGLLNADGKVNRSGIEDCAKVANWRPTGGSPKTPGE